MLFHVGFKTETSFDRLLEVLQPFILTQFFGCPSMRDSAAAIASMDCGFDIRGLLLPLLFVCFCVWG
jgi:hypothetical protein